jgi:hypothetical protein
MLGTAWKPTLTLQSTPHGPFVNLNFVILISSLMRDSTSLLAVSSFESTSPAYGLAKRSSRLARWEAGTSESEAPLPKESFPPASESCGVEEEEDDEDDEDDDVPTVFVSSAVSLKGIRGRTRK